MHTISTLFRISVLLFTLMMTISSVATTKDQPYKQHGDIKIFYSVLNSSFITPKVAVANDIVRGKDRGLINIAVMKEMGVGIPSKVRGEVLNIFQQRQILDFVEVREGDALYYLAPFKFTHQDYLTFTISIMPNYKSDILEDEYQFKFQKTMYHDP